MRTTLPQPCYTDDAVFAPVAVREVVHRPAPRRPGVATGGQNSSSKRTRGVTGSPTIRSTTARACSSTGSSDRASR